MSALRVLCSAASWANCAGQSDVDATNTKALRRSAVIFFSVSTGVRSLEISPALTAAVDCLKKALSNAGVPHLAAITRKSASRCSGPVALFDRSAPYALMDATKLTADITRPVLRLLIRFSLSKSNFESIVSGASL